MSSDALGRAVVALIAALIVALIAALMVVLIRQDSSSDEATTETTATVIVREEAGPDVVAAGEDPAAGAVTDTVASDPARRGYPLIFAPVNDSGVTGTGAVTPGPGGRLTVVFGVEGLTPDAAHPQAIHEPRGQAADIRCPTPDDDADGDGVLTLRESQAAYGPARLDLRPYPVAEDGRVEFKAEYVVPRELQPLTDGAVVIYGAGVGAALPVACALITPG